MAHIVSIVYTPDDVERQPDNHYARVPLQRAVLIESHGIQGDIKGNRGTRQLNVMQAETLEELKAAGLKAQPGELGEQIIVSGLPMELLGEGTLLRIGLSAQIQVGIPRTGCGRFEHIQNTSKKNVVGRLGVLAKVASGGEIAVGDEVVVVEHSNPLSPKPAVQKRKIAEED